MGERLELGSWGLLRSVEDSLGQSDPQLPCASLFSPQGLSEKAAWQSVFSAPPFSLTPPYAVM
jgi:hypothetical protein